VLPEETLDDLLGNPSTNLWAISLRFAFKTDGDVPSKLRTPPLRSAYKSDGELPSDRHQNFHRKTA
jgi:hypothetical protein